MNIFKKKNNTYKVTCYLDKTKQVRELAEKYAVAGSVVEVRAHDYLLINDVRVTVVFESKESEPVIYKAVLEAFYKYQVKINGNTISIYKEVGLK